MQVNGTMLASELRRRRVGPKSMLDALDRVDRSTWVLGELQAAPTPLLVLAALSMTTIAAPTTVETPTAEAG